MSNDLTLNESYLKAIFDAQSDILLITINGEEMERCNTSLLNFLGFSSIEEFKKHHRCICDLFEEEGDSYITKRYGGMDWLTFILKNSDRQNKVKIRKDKEVRYFSIRATPIEFDKQRRFVVTMHDITRLESEKIGLSGEIDKLLEVFKLSEDILNIAIFEFNPENYTFFASNGFSKIFELEKKNLYGLNEIKNLISSLDITEFESKINYIMFKKQSGSINFKIVTESGALRFINCYFHYRKDSQNGGFIGFFQDYTKEHLLNKLQEQQEGINFIKHKIKSQRDMLNSIAHHWRQPLTVISLNISYLESVLEKNGLIDDNIETMIEQTMDKISFLSNTINEFLSISGDDKTKQPLFIKKELEKLIKLKSATLEEKNINISIEGVEKEIDSYKKELLRIVEYGLQNAIEAIERHREMMGEHIIGEIKVATFLDDKNLYITIDDNGIGIEKEVGSKVFEPYFTTKFMSPGVGLSLYFAKTIINTVFNGDITITPSKSQGAKLTISFPVNV